MEPDPATVVFDDFPHNGEPCPGTAAVLIAAMQPPEYLEHSVVMLSRDAYAVVAYLKRGRFLAILVTHVNQFFSHCCCISPRS